MKQKIKVGDTVRIVEAYPGSHNDELAEVVDPNYGPFTDLILVKLQNGGYWNCVKVKKVKHPTQIFKVGDRVMAVSNVDPDKVPRPGVIEKLYRSKPFPKSYDYWVRYDEGYCAWSNVEALPKTKHPVIVITTDGKTTTATLREGKKVLKTAEARCNADDTFSFAEGARIAFERLQGRDPFPKQEPERPSKLVCVRPYGNHLKAGKVYSAYWHGSDFTLDIGFGGEVRDGRYIVGFVSGEAEFIPFVED